jgi:hypothetical protein
MSPASNSDGEGDLIGTLMIVGWRGGGGGGWTSCSCESTWAVTAGATFEDSGYFNMNFGLAKLGWLLPWGLCFCGGGVVGIGGIAKLGGDGDGERWGRGETWKGHCLTSTEREDCAVD